MLEELPEEDQVEILEHLDSERAADILEEMSPDDAADLIADLPPETAARLLELMEPDEAEDVRRLMAYGEETAGGMMTPEPVILPPDATVAEALAHVRHEELADLAGRAWSTCAGRRWRRRPASCLGRRPHPAPAARAALDPGRGRAGQAIDPLRSGPTPRSGGRRPPGRPTTWSRRPWSTTRGACSAWSPSTTCSTTCSPRTGATAPAQPHRRPVTEDVAVTERAAAQPARHPPRDRAGRCCAGPTPTSDAFGIFAEQFARFMGTARFLIYMTLFVVVWIAWNLTAPEDLRCDAYPFIFLTLMLSLQASYAAPLILLAQNRQEVRDKVIAEQDRQVNARAHADMEFLAREVASLRMAVGEVATRDFLRSELRSLLGDLDERLEPRRATADATAADAGRDPTD